MTAATNGVVQALRGLVATYGIDRVTTDAAWVRNILADLSPETRAINRILMFAVQEGIPADLRRAATSGSVSLAIARGVARLVGEYGIDQGIATNAVNAWAHALALADTVVPPPKPTTTPPEVSVALAPVLSTETTPPRRKPDDNELRSGADLSGSNLAYRNLSKANLTNANLREANPTGAKLDGAIGYEP